MTVDASAVYYTRCPVPTASGIAFRRDTFSEVFAGSGYVVRNITELGATYQNVHFTHTIENFFREGGGSPPIWARASGVDSVLLGVTFMDELLGIYVRADDPATSVTELAGRRLALPVWPHLVFNFWRFAAQKGFYSALRVHGMSQRDVVFDDVVEDWDPHEKRNPSSQHREPPRCDYRNQLRALLAGEVDAIFAKGGEAALLEREGGTRIRLLFDIGNVSNIEHRINNSTPRLLTTSRSYCNKHPEAVVRYVQSVVRAARWARDHPLAARSVVAAECGTSEEDVTRVFKAGFVDDFTPLLSPELIATVHTMKTFLFEHGYLQADFAIEDWVDAEPLAEATRRESPRLQP